MHRTWHISNRRLYCSINYLHGSSPVLQALAINLVNFGYNTDTNIHRAFLYGKCFSQLLSLASKLPMIMWSHPLFQQLQAPAFVPVFQASIPVITALTR